MSLIKLIVNTFSEIKFSEIKKSTFVDFEFFPIDYTGVCRLVRKTIDGCIGLSFCDI